MAQNIKLNKEVFNKRDYEKTIDTKFNQLGVKSVQEQIDDIQINSKRSKDIVVGRKLVPAFSSDNELHVVYEVKAEKNSSHHTVAHTWQHSKHPCYDRVEKHRR